MKITRICGVEAEVAETIFQRMRGLLGRDSLATGKGLLILKCNVNIDALNIPLVGSFPLYYKKLFVKGCKQEHFESVPYFNLMYAKRGIIRRKVNRRIEQWCETTEGEKVLFFYSYTFLPIIEQLKKKYKIKVFVLAADLPEYMAVLWKF